MGLRFLLPPAAALALVLTACREETVVRHPDGGPKVIRSYGLFGGRDSTNLVRERTFHSNGKPERDARFKGGAMHGPYVDFWQNGQKKSQGRYVDGKRQGTWEFYFNQYSVAAKGDFKDDRKDGPWNEFYENGELRAQGGYRDGADTGTWRRWGTKGDLLEENSCFEANAEGRFKSFHAANTPKEDYACRKGFPVGPYSKLSPEGEVAERGTFDSLGKRDGTWETFHPGHLPATRKGWRHGVEADSVLAWDAKGRLRERGFRVDGAGTVEKYDSLGRLAERATRAAGGLDGETWSFHPDGKKKSRIEYKGGLPLTLQRWHPNGKLSQEGRFEAGKRTGEWKRFGEQGQPLEVARYEKGLMHGERHLYDSTGKLTQVQRYERGYPAEGKFPGGLKPTYQKEKDPP